MKKITIAIDGFSSTGKSTLAKTLAKYLGYVYVDTGAMYRAITWFAVENNMISTEFFDKEKLIEVLNDVKLQFVFNEEKGFGEIYVNGKNVEQQIRTLEISNLVSKVAEVSEIRTALVAQQKNFGKAKGVVMDGRDIGTVVFPDAELKLFMTASDEVRAKRRFEELSSKGMNVSFEEVLKSNKERDFIDTNRVDSPLRKAKDAIEIDNTNLNQEQQFELVKKLAQDCINKP